MTGKHEPFNTTDLPGRVNNGLYLWQAFGWGMGDRRGWMDMLGWWDCCAFKHLLCFPSHHTLCGDFSLLFPSPSLPPFPFLWLPRVSQKQALPCLCSPLCCVYVCYTLAPILASSCEHCFLPSSSCMLCWWLYFSFACWLPHMPFCFLA